MFNIVVTRPVSKPEVSVPNVVPETQALSGPVYVETYDIPAYYLNPLSFILYFLWITFSVFVLQGILVLGIYLIIILRRKKIICPYCKKKIIYSGKKPYKCLNCGQTLEQKIKVP